MNLEVDLKGLDAKLNRLRQSRRPTRETLATVLAGHVVDNLVANSREDTGRYKAAWVQAGEGVGITRHMRPPIGPSKYTDKIVQTIAEQIEDARRHKAFLEQRLATWYTNKGRKPDKHSRKLEREIRREQKTIEIGIENLKTIEKESSVIVIGVSKSAHLKGQRHLAWFTSDANRGRARVRHKIYGGEGRMIHGGNTTVLILHNKEAHARIVEYRYSTMRNALASAKIAGFRSMSKRFRAELRAAADPGFKA